MKALFELDHNPQYAYITEEYAQNEYSAWCAYLQYLRLYGGVYPAYLSSLNFEQWLTHMEYNVY